MDWSGVDLSRIPEVSPVIAEGSRGCWRPGPDRQSAAARAGPDRAPSSASASRHRSPAGSSRYSQLSSPTEGPVGPAAASPVGPSITRAISPAHRRFMGKLLSLTRPARRGSGLASLPFLPAVRPGNKQAESPRPPHLRSDAPPERSTGGSAQTLMGWRSAGVSILHGANGTGRLAVRPAILRGATWHGAGRWVRFGAPGQAWLILSGEKELTMGIARSP